MAPVPIAVAPLAIVDVTPPLALRLLPSAVSTPVPAPVNPVDIGRPLAFVSVNDEGVPRDDAELNVSDGVIVTAPVDTLPILMVPLPLALNETLAFVPGR